MAYDQTLAARVRKLLETMGGATELSMMGALCFLRGGNMACGVSGDRLMVRLGAEAASDALHDPDVSPLSIGGGRSPRAFVTVAPRGIADEKALAAWVARGLAFADSLPAKSKA